MLSRSQKLDSNKNTVTGIYRQSSSPIFGFVDLPEQGGSKKRSKNSGYYVFHLNKLNALDGDEVLASVRTFKGREEAIVKKILKRTDKTLVGEFFPGNSKNAKKVTYGFVKLKNASFHSDVFIPGKFLGEAQDGDIVGVKIISWENKNPDGKIVSILGNKDDVSIDVDSFVLEAGFEKEFNNKIDNDLANVSDKISDKEIKKRYDLRNLFTFTIDGEDAKDLDDAISIKKKENGDFRLFVHIADVSHYVRENSVLDKEALGRGTSVYLANEVIPMLPTKLSNNLCSLNPDSDKLTLTCEMLIGKEGDLRKTMIYESVIKSDFRLTYKEVDEIVCVKKSLGDVLFCSKSITDDLLGKVKLCEELRKIIAKRKEISGVLNFDFPETKIFVDKDFEVTDIKPYPRYASNKMIEEFMVMCNEAVSRKFSTYPFLYRVHESPSLDDIPKLEDALKLFGINFKFESCSTSEFSKLLSIISKADSSLGGKKQTLEKLILRTLSKARYSDENFGHFGLGLKFYSHFTSPIRRYPDLIIHRIIKEKLSGSLDTNKVIYYKKVLGDISLKCSGSEVRAEKLEYRVRDYFIVKYYRNRVGEEFEATIAGVLPSLIFVSLDDSAEGSVQMEGMFYNEDFMRFEDRSSGKNLSLGDRVRVRLVEADLERCRLNFELL